MISRKRERSGSLSNSVDCAVEPPARSPCPNVPQPLGPFLWSEVSMSLYACVLRYLHLTCGLVAMERSPSLRVDLLTAAHARVSRLCARETSSLREPERTSHSAVVSRGLSSLFDHFFSLSRDLSIPSRGALCAALLRGLTAAGFPEDDGLAADESQLQTAVRRAAEPHAYSYSARCVFSLPVPPRYDGDRRAEAQHRQPRVGRVVRLPRRHKHAEVNTHIQLIEPKRRRPPLDENRIFLHPKKATASAAEDFAVDEELQFRALVVLERHLDAVGSLDAVPPFARMALWNALGRDEALFDRLTSPNAEFLLPPPHHHNHNHNNHNAPMSNDPLTELRRRIAQKRAAFDATRSAARDAALRVGWFAASAHWRDQVLRVVEDAEDSDWYLLRDAAKCGGRAVFPNYAPCAAVREFALRALRRVRDKRTTTTTSTTSTTSTTAITTTTTTGTGGAMGSTMGGIVVDDAAECYDVVECVLLPLLEGRAPLTKNGTDPTGMRKRISALFSREQQQQQKKKNVEENSAEANEVSTEEAARWVFDCEAFTPAQSAAPSVFVTDIFVWPLQCLAALLELCATARHSAEGLKKFSAAFVASNWGDEEALLEFLLRREPTNTTLATLVGLPRLVRDVFTSAQWLRNDKSFAAVVECRAQSAALPVATRGFMCWRVLAAALTAVDYSGELHALTVRDGQKALEDGKMWTVAELQCTPRAWVEGLDLMMSDC